jgi:hypothetical protein
MSGEPTVMGPEPDYQRDDREQLSMLASYEARILAQSDFRNGRRTRMDIECRTIIEDISVGFTNLSSFGGLHREIVDFPSVFLPEDFNGRGVFKKQIGMAIEGYVDFIYSYYISKKEQEDCIHIIFLIRDEENPTNSFSGVFEYDGVREYARHPRFIGIDLWSVDTIKTWIGRTIYPTDNNTYLIILEGIRTGLSIFSDTMPAIRQDEDRTQLIKTIMNIDTIINELRSKPEGTLFNVEYESFASPGVGAASSGIVLPSGTVVPVENKYLKYKKKYLRLKNSL